jgi:AraC-like DNA-binding protein
MEMSRRTLHRRLGAYGLRFQEVLDETHCEFAQQLPANARLSISKVATIVGYADPSILTRSFERWMGLSPSQWRSNFANCSAKSVG